MAVRKFSEEHLALLNQGKAEAKNLMESLSIDFNILLKNTFPHLSFPDIPSSLGVVKRMEQAASYISAIKDEQLLDQLRNSLSDTVRGWACYVVFQKNLPLGETLELIRPFADDQHYGVREWAWLALRPMIAENFEEGVALLTQWVASPSSRLRRFAIEITRPRGVWCRHLPALKEDPSLGLPLLEAVKTDPALYVQLSAGNWLNDAGKTQPEWVKTLCAHWLSQSQENSLLKICKRALRNL